MSDTVETSEDDFCGEFDRIDLAILEAKSRPYYSASEPVYKLKEGLLVVSGCVAGNSSFFCPRLSLFRILWNFNITCLIMIVHVMKVFLPSVIMAGSLYKLYQPYNYNLADYFNLAFNPLIFNPAYNLLNPRTMKTGNTLKHFRKQLKLDQKELAEKTGLSASYISRIERDLQDPSLKTLRRISEAMGIPLPLLVFRIMESEENKEDKVNVSLNGVLSLLEKKLVSEAHRRNT